jgi:hypothetical protein
LLRQKQDDLYTRDPELSLRIEIQFKSIRPEFIKTEEGFRYSIASEIALYASKRYGIHLSMNSRIISILKQTVPVLPTKKLLWKLITLH